MSAKRKSPSSQPFGREAFLSPGPTAKRPSNTGWVSPFAPPGEEKTQLPAEPDIAFQTFARRVQALRHGGSIITIADYYDFDRNKAINHAEFKKLVTQHFGFDDFNDDDAIQSLFDHILKYESPRTRKEQKEPSFGYFTFIKAVNYSLFVSPSKRPLRDHVLYWSPHDVIPSWQVRFALEELNIRYTSAISRGTTVEPSEFYGTPPLRKEAPVLTVKKHDVESTFSGADAILLYLAHTKGLIIDPKADEHRYAKTISRFHETRQLAKILEKDAKYPEEQLRAELAIWNGYLEKEDYLATEFSIADIALFPLLATVHAKRKLPAALVNYYKRIANRPSVLATQPAAKPIERPLFQS